MGLELYPSSSRTMPSSPGTIEKPVKSAQTLACGIPLDRSCNILWTKICFSNELVVVSIAIFEINTDFMALEPQKTHTDEVTESTKTQVFDFRRIGLHTTDVNSRGLPIWFP